MKFITGTQITSFWSSGSETDDKMEGPIQFNLDHVASIEKYHGKPHGLQDGYVVTLSCGRRERVVSTDITRYIESL